MIALTRSLCRDLRAVCKKIAAGRGSHPPLDVSAGPHGLTVRCSTSEVTVIYRRPGRQGDGRVVVPAEVLADAAGKDDSLVNVRDAGKDRVEASWTDAGIPMAREYSAPERPLPVAPALPPCTPPAPPELIEALDAAGNVADHKDASRFALGCILLRGASGEVAATDSKQLLLLGGLSFPFRDDVLVPRTGVFGALAALKAGPVTVGRTPTAVWVNAGPWSVGLTINKLGKFPPVTGVIPVATTSGVTILTFDPDDAKALAAALPRLPGAKDDCKPVTLHLAARAVVRAKGEGDVRAAEFLLGRSSVSGPAVRFACDRHYLLRAIDLGFRTLFVVSADKPVGFRDGPRAYGFMPLPINLAVESVNGPAGPEVPVPAPDRNGRYMPPRPVHPMPSPKPPPAAPSVPKGVTPQPMVPAMPKGPQPSRHEPAMRPVPTHSPAGAARFNPPSRQPKQRRQGAGLVEETTAVRDTLRGLLGRIRGLLGLARKQRQETRVVHSTLATLKQLDRPGR